MDEGISPTTAALPEWVELSEALVRGLVHGFNNRFTALSAYLELSAMGDEEFSPARILPAELVRLQALTAHLRLVISDDAEPESIEMGPVLEDALALLAHHPRMRTIRCEVVHDGSLPPVRVPRWAFLRLLMTMIEEGRRVATREGRKRTTLRLSGVDDGASIGIDAPALSAYGAVMAARCGGEVMADASGVAVRLPGLATVRARERTARVRDGDA